MYIQCYVRKNFVGNAMPFCRARLNEQKQKHRAPQIATFSRDISTHFFLIKS